LAVAVAEGRVSLLNRALGTSRALVSVHLELAQEEAAQDAGRVASGALMLAVVAGMVGSSLLLVDVALVALVMTRAELDLGLSALAVAAGHLVVALPIALIAIGRLKQPVMKKTRGRVKETVAALRGT
jgi:hypothetical protein